MALNNKIRKNVEGIIVFIITIIIFLNLIYDDLINKWVLSSTYLILAAVIVIQKFNQPKK